MNDNGKIIQPNKDTERVELKGPMIGNANGWVLVKIPFIDEQGKEKEAQIQVDPEGADSFAELLKKNANQARQTIFGK